MGNLTVLVFGGSGGIGKAFCELAEKRSINVVVADIKEPLDGCRAEYVHADLSKESDVKRAILYALDKYQSIDAVINCQGIYQVDLIEKTTSSDFDKMLDVNIKTVFYVCKNIVPIMKWQKNGYIINVASMSGLRGRRGQIAYCASKFAVVGLSDALYEELRGTGVRVTAICPSSVNTSMLHGAVRLSDSESAQVLQPVDVAQVMMTLIFSKYRVCRKIVPMEGIVEIDKLERKNTN